MYNFIIVPQAIIAHFCPLYNSLKTLSSKTLYPPQKQNLPSRPLNHPTGHDRFRKIFLDVFFAMLGVGIGFVPAKLMVWNAWISISIKMVKAWKEQSSHLHCSLKKFRLRLLPQSSELFSYETMNHSSQINIIVGRG
jgi:hypothetical protein